MPNGVDRVLVLWDWPWCDSTPCHLVSSASRCGDHPEATLMSRSGMLPLRGGLAAAGNSRPIIFHGFCLNGPADQHRSDSEHHAPLNAGQPHTRTEGKN